MLVRAQSPDNFYRDRSLPPWSRNGITVFLTMLSIVILLVPGANDCLQFERSAVAAGQWWRILAGHFTHWGNEHLAWDLLVFSALGLICERADRSRFLAGLLASSLLIPLTLWVLAPGMQTYRGLSGLDTTLFMILAVSALRTCYSEHRWSWFCFVALLLLGLLAKIGFETWTNRAVFVDAASAGFQSVPQAHVIGALVGAIVGFFDRPESEA